MSERKRVQIQRKRIKRNRKIAVLTLAAICIIALGLIYNGFITDASKSQNTYKYYTDIKVELGDTLWDIANEYITDDYNSIKEYIAEVREINSICDDDIYYGQRLMVPYYSEEIK